MQVQQEEYRSPHRQDRRTRSGVRRLAMATAICVAQAGVLAFVPAVSYAAVPSFHTSLDPNKVQESMHYLIDTYGVSKDEALRRLELQNDAQALDALLTKQSPQSYGGMWLDQENGGQLVLAMTNPADAKPYVAAMPDRANVQTRTVERSRQELEQTRQALSNQVGEGADSVYLTSIDVQKNSVVMWERAQWRFFKGSWLVGA